MLKYNQSIIKYNVNILNVFNIKSFNRSNLSFWDFMVKVILPINYQDIYGKHRGPNIRGSHLSMVRLKIKSKSWTILEGSFPITIIGFHIKLKISLIRYFSFVFNLYHFCFKSLNVVSAIFEIMYSMYYKCRPILDILKEKRHPMIKFRTWKLANAQFQCQIYSQSKLKINFV